MTGKGGVLLRAQNIKCEFGGVRALSGVTLEVERNTVHSVIGPNGAGKTTLVKVLSGEITPSEGEVSLEGQRLGRRKPRHRTRLGMGRCFQVTSVFPSLTVLENVRLGFQAKGGFRSFNMVGSVGQNHWTVEAAERTLDKVGLLHKGNQLAGTISYGEQRLLEIGLALSADPKILLLDEPAAGIGMGEVSILKRLLKDLAAQYTILLIEHNIQLVMELSDWITVMFRGQVLRSGRPADIAVDREVREVYLGGG